MPYGVLGGRCGTSPGASVKKTDNESADFHIRTQRCPSRCNNLFATLASTLSQAPTAREQGAICCTWCGYGPSGKFTGCKHHSLPDWPKILPIEPVPDKCSSERLSKPQSLEQQMVSEAENFPHCRRRIGSLVLDAVRLPSSCWHLWFAKQKS